MIESSSQPLVSIVFTSYNHAEFLRQALDSLLNQSFRNFELIIVDDNSTDGSKDILQEYRQNDRINLHLLEKNTGSYVKASNYGAKLANGTFILFAQCDDFANPNQLQLLIDSFKNDDTIGVVWSRSNMVDVHGTIFEDDYEGREKRFRDRCMGDTLLQGEEMRRFLSYSCVIPNLSAALVKRDLYLEAGGLSEKYLVVSDWAFWLTLSELTNFYYLAEPLNNFRQHSTTIRSKIKIERQIIEIYSVFYEHLYSFKLTGSAALTLRIGAGLVWFSFIFMGFSAWIKSFPAVLRKSFRVEKLNLLFLILGVFIYSREVIFNRFKN